MKYSGNMNQFALIFQRKENDQWTDMLEIRQYSMDTLAEYATRVQNGYRPLGVSHSKAEDYKTPSITRLKTISQIF